MFSYTFQYFANILKFSKYANIFPLFFIRGFNFPCRPCRVAVCCRGFVVCVVFVRLSVERGVFAFYTMKCFWCRLRSMCHSGKTCHGR